MGTPDRPRAPHPTRRALLALSAGALVVAAMPRARRDGRRRVVRTVPVMGTIAELTVLADDPRRAHAALDAAVAELTRLEARLTRYDDASDVGRANRGAAIGPVEVGAETALVVEEALRWAEASDGAFDPCLERAIELWDVVHRRTPPADALVRRLAGRRLFRAVDVDRSATGGTLRFSDPDVGLDLGGIAKGYAVDRAAAAMRACGVHDGLVNVGGDLVALGRAETGDPWRIGIRSPTDPEALAGTVEVSDAAIATSGDYERYFDFDGHRYHHILDAATAAPRRSATHSVTILAPSCLAADAAATACFGRDDAFARRLLASRAPGARLVALA